MATRGHDLPAPPTLAPLAGPLRLAGVLHAAWLDPRAAVQTLQSRVLFPQLRDQPLLLSHLAQQLHHQRLQRFERQAINVSRGGHTQLERRTASAQAISQSRPGFCPCYRGVRAGRRRSRVYLWVLSDTICRYLCSAAFIAISLPEGIAGVGTDCIYTEHLLAVGIPSGANPSASRRCVSPPAHDAAQRRVPRRRRAECEDRAHSMHRRSRAS